MEISMMPWSSIPPRERLAMPMSGMYGARFRIIRKYFVDDGDINIKRTLEILKKNHFEGVLIPDHTPQIQCQDTWHAGMAFALGFIRAELMGLEG